MNDLLGQHANDPPPMDAPLPWRVYRTNDYCWYIARSLDEAMEAHTKDCGEEPDEPRELTDEELERRQFYVDGPRSARIPFAVALRDRVSQGITKPELFACMEY